MKRSLLFIAWFAGGCFTVTPVAEVPCDPKAPACPTDQQCIRHGPGEFACEPEGVAPVLPFCGDGFVDAEVGEQCDDGNRNVGDGCSQACRVERGFECDNASPTTCLDVDECVQKTTDCDPNATCTNTPGAYSCACNDYFVGDGLQCMTPRQQVVFLSAGHTTYTVPSAVHRLVVKIWGAGGGGGGTSDSSNTYPLGGGGGFVTASLDVTPGEILAIDVGAPGDGGKDSDPPTATPHPGGLGGAPGGGSAGAGSVDGGPSGGGGGGYSAISRGPFMLVIAGGGGGSGGDVISMPNAPRGGGAGNPAAPGLGSAVAGSGGGGATTLAPGSGGIGGLAGKPGTMGLGGTAPDAEGAGRSSGGGGGGGYFGGGSGASGSTANGSTGGGGGGSSNAAVANAMFTSATSTMTSSSAGMAMDDNCLGCGSGGSHAAAGRAGRVVIRY